MKQPMLEKKIIQTYSGFEFFKIRSELTRNFNLDKQLLDLRELPYILVYKSNFLDVKMDSKNRPRLIFGRT